MFTVNFACDVKFSTMSQHGQPFPLGTYTTLAIGTVTQGTSNSAKWSNWNVMCPPPGLCSQDGEVHGVVGNAVPVGDHSPIGSLQVRLPLSQIEGHEVTNDAIILQRNDEVNHRTEREDAEDCNRQTHVVTYKRFIPTWWVWFKCCFKQYFCLSA